MEINIEKVRPRFNAFKIEKVTSSPYSNLTYTYGGIRFYMNYDICVDSGEVIRYGIVLYQLAGHCPIRGIDVAAYFFPYFEVDGATKYNFRIGLDPEIRIVLTGGVDFPGVSGETDQIIADRLPGEMLDDVRVELEDQRIELWNQILYNMPTIWGNKGAIPRIHLWDELNAVLCSVDCLENPSSTYPKPNYPEQRIPCLWSTPYGFYGLADAYSGDPDVRKMLYMGTNIDQWSSYTYGRKCN